LTLRPFQQTHSLGFYRYALSHRAKTLAGFAFYKDSLDWEIQHRRKVYAYLFTIGEKLRLLAAYYAVQVDNMPALLPRHAEDRTEQRHRIGILPCRILGRKKNAYIPKACGAQYRIGNRMGKHIPVGMTQFSAVRFKFNASQQKTPALDKTVYVTAQANMYHVSSLPDRKDFSR
jgi:hypothetical protein